MKRGIIALDVARNLICQMNPNLKDNYLTLDWDRITEDEALLRCAYIWNRWRFMIARLKLSMSPCNGYHVRIWTYTKVLVAKWRRLWKDDGRRLIHDLIDNPDHIHDILWNEKDVTPIISFGEVPLKDWNH